MRILIVNKCTIPVNLYGGTERVIWNLGKELVKMGHQVSYLVKSGSHCDFATVIPINDNLDLVDQIPDDVDLVHFHATPTNLHKLKKPYLITIHGNSNDERELDLNCVFVSQNHANRYGSNSFVHNGLDWDEYPKPDLEQERGYFHFLGNAAWRVKNVQGAIDIIKATRTEKLKVLGGQRFNFKMGMRFTFSHRIHFNGMVGGIEKARLLNGSKGLVFPVKWHEPFGLAIIESLFYGCPVFGTPYGALPELVNKDVGFLSNSSSELTEAVKTNEQFSKTLCHEYAVETFNSRNMALAYLGKYELVTAGRTLNPQPPKLQEVQKGKFLDWN